MTTAKDNDAELACSLTAPELEQRRALVRKRLLPHIVDYRVGALELELRFSNGEQLRSELEQFVELERQCCGFLDFILSPAGDQMRLKIQGPEGSQTTLKAFAQAVSGGAHGCC